MIEIPKSEFNERVRKVQDAMKKNHLDGLFVYGDEYRRENLRYLSNFWPIFERGAFCIGQTVHAVQVHSEGRQPRFVAADQLAQAVNLDMADWWAPTKESYLGRVKKDQILEAIEQGTSETNFEDLRKLKKGELVAAAERRLAGGRWLPRILKP